MSSQVEIYSTSTDTVHLQVFLDVNDADYYDHLCAFFENLVDDGVQGPFSWRPVEEQSMTLTNEEIAELAQAEIQSVFPLEVQTLTHELVETGVITGAELTDWNDGVGWITSMRSHYETVIAGPPVEDVTWPTPPANLATLVSAYRGFY